MKSQSQKLARMMNMMMPTLLKGWFLRWILYILNTKTRTSRRAGFFVKQREVKVKKTWLAQAYRWVSRELAVNQPHIQKEYVTTTSSKNSNSRGPRRRSSLTPRSWLFVAYMVVNERSSQVWEGDEIPIALRGRALFPRSEHRWWPTRPWLPRCGFPTRTAASLLPVPMR